MGTHKKIKTKSTPKGKSKDKIKITATNYVVEDAVMMLVTDDNEISVWLRYRFSRC